MSNEINARNTLARTKDEPVHAHVGVSMYVSFFCQRDAPLSISNCRLRVFEQEEEEEEVEGETKKRL